jgi:dTDP-4-dehydrorhamnose reductase
MLGTPSKTESRQKMLSHGAKSQSQRKKRGRVRVALIGAKGQLGSDLSLTLGANGYEVVSLTHAKIEVTDIGSIRLALIPVTPDVVINTAAYHKVEEVEQNPVEGFAVNTIGPHNLALVCKDLESPLLHLSSDYVFSGRKATPYVESDAVDPLNIYGVSKAAGEMILRYLWPRHFIVRTSGLYGKAGSSGKGGNFVELMLQLAREGKSIKVVNDQILTPTSTHALALQIAALIKTDAYGTYHATCQGECTWYDFAVEIFRRAGLNPQLSPQTTTQSGARVKRPPYSVLENANLKCIGIDLMPSWQDALQSYLTERKIEKGN